MPELVVEPFKGKCFLQIVMSELFDITCNMKWFARMGIIPYVKMNFQIILSGSARIYRNFLNVCFVLFSRKSFKWILLKNKQGFTGYCSLFLLLHSFWRFNSKESWLLWHCLSFVLSLQKQWIFYRMRLQFICWSREIALVWLLHFYLHASLASIAACSQTFPVVCHLWIHCRPL